MPNDTQAQVAAAGRSITERYALATLLALVVLVIIAVGAILLLSSAAGGEVATSISLEAAILSSVVGLVGPAVGGLIVMLQNAQVRATQQQAIETAAAHAAAIANGIGAAD